MRFQWIEDFFGTKRQWCDGWLSGGSSNALSSTDNFNDSATNYSSYDIGFSGNMWKYAKKVQGTSELGFLIKSNAASETTYFCDYQNFYGNIKKVASVGGDASDGTGGGAFCFCANYDASDSGSPVGARLMFL